MRPEASSPDISHPAPRRSHSGSEDLTRRRRRHGIRAKDKTAWRFCLPASVLGVFLAAFAPASRAADTDANLKHFRDIAETQSYRLGRPVSPKISPDGRSVIFLRSGPRDRVLRLYELDLATGRERELLTPAQLPGGTEEKISAEEKARRERQRQTLKGFTSFQLSKDGAQLLVSLSGQLHVVARADLKITALPGSGWIDPRFSPDGKFVAAAAGGELHVIDLASGEPGRTATATGRAITSGATATLSHGTSEFVAQEEMGRPEGFWWSPDSRTLLCQETDESGVEVRYISDPLHPETAPTKFFYPRAGTPNAIVRLLLVSRDGGKPLPVAWDNAAFPYLAHVGWARNSPLTILVQNREQTDQRLLAVDPATGRSHELLRETDAAWLNLDSAARTPRWLEDGSAFLWTTERGGSWQVELRNAQGAFLRPLTPAGWSYAGLVGVDEASGQVFVLGGDDPREVQLWSFPLAGGAGTALTFGRGQQGATYSEEARLLVRTTDRFDGIYRCEIITAARGRVLATLPSVAESPARWPDTEFTRTAGARAFDAALTRPRALVAGRKYPVILSVYAGPTAKVVSADVRGFLADQWMADQGYVVVRLDGRGTPRHGREWERVIKGNFIDLALEDQIAGLRALAGKFSELDLARVGVTGWSFGGYFAAMATIRRPDVFRCGVAGAPVVTWENYDTHYTERYLGVPPADAYRVSNVTTYAAQLERPLLLIHGLTDDNVYFQHTLQLADALFLAGKHYELLPMLGTHMAAKSDPIVGLREQLRVIEFFNRELRP